MTSSSAKTLRQLPRRFVAMAIVIPALLLLGGCHYHGAHGAYGGHGYHAKKRAFHGHYRGYGRGYSHPSHFHYRARKRGYYGRD